MTLKKPTQTASIQTITLRSKTAGLFLDSSKGLFHVCLGGHSAFEGKLSVPRQAQPWWRRCKRLEVSQCSHQSKLLLCPSAGRPPEPPAPAASSRLHRSSPLQQPHTTVTFNSSVGLQRHTKHYQEGKKKEKEKIYGREYTALPRLIIHKVQS